MSKSAKKCKNEITWKKTEKEVRRVGIHEAQRNGTGKVSLPSTFEDYEQMTFEERKCGE